MNHKKEQLFRVINHLSPNEKAYFRKFTYKVSKEDSSVFQLFELIEKAQRKGEIDENKLTKEFQKINPNADYIKVKSNLLHKLFEAIVNYDRNSSTLHELFELLELADSLFKRKLIHDALHTLKKAEKIALQNQELELLLKIKEQYISLEAYVRVFNRNVFEHSFYNDSLNYLKLLQNKMLVREATQQVHHFQKLIGTPRSMEDLEILKSIEASPGLKINFDALDDSSKMDQTLSLCIIYFSKGDFEGVIKICKSFLSKYKQETNTNKLLSTKLLSIYDSLMQACLMNKNLSEFKSIYNQFEKLNFNYNEHIRLKNGISLYVKAVAGTYELNFNSFEQLDQQFSAIENDELIPNYRKVSLAYYLIFGLFLSEKFNLAASRISWLLQKQDINIRYDIDVAVRVMNLIILLEKDEWYHLEYAIRNFKQLLENRERKFELELHFIKMLKKALQTKSAQELKTQLIDIRKDIEKCIEKNPIEANFLTGFDLLSWIESKLQNRSFKEIYLKKIGIL
jgi:hypothetical protein